jgi:hypothetical protein
VPFLRPLLPVDHPPVTIASNLSSKSSAASDQISDLLSVLEKVRQLKYISVAEFRDDLEGLRFMVRKRVDAQDSEEEKLANQSIVQAFDTLLGSANTYIKNRQETISSLELSIRAKFGVDSEDEDDETQRDRSLEDQQTLMQRMWRKECERGTWAVPSSSSSSTAAVVFPRVDGRPLRYWALFVESGLVGSHVLEREDGSKDDFRSDRGKEIVENYLSSLGIDDMVMGLFVCLFFIWHVI